MSETQQVSGSLPSRDASVRTLSDRARLGILHQHMCWVMVPSHGHHFSMSAVAQGWKDQSRSPVVSLRPKPAPVTGLHYCSVRKKTTQKGSKPATATPLVELRRPDVQMPGEEHIKEVPSARAAHWHWCQDLCWSCSRGAPGQEPDHRVLQDVDAGIDVCRLVTSEFPRPWWGGGGGVDPAVDLVTTPASRGR